MNGKVIQISVATLLVMVAGALFLGTWQKRHRLGIPGLRVVNEPVYGIDDTGRRRTSTNIFLAGTNSIYMPARIGDFESKADPISKLVLDWLPKDTTYGQRIYQAKDGFRIQAYTVLMGKDRTSIHLPQYCLTMQGWTIAEQELTAIRMTQPKEYDLPAMKLKARIAYKDEHGKERTWAGVFVYWFVADQQLTADHRTRMWWMARDLLRTGVLQRWAYVTYFSTCAPGQEDATYARMREFIAAAVPQFQLTPAPESKIAGISTTGADTTPFVSRK